MIWPGFVAAQQGADVTVHHMDHPDRVWADTRYNALDARWHVSELHNVPEADILVFQRPLSRIMVEAMRLLQGRGFRIVVELDDDLARIDPRNMAHDSIAPHMNGESNWNHLQEALDLADWRMFSTSHLLHRYGRPGDWVVRNAIPDAYLDLEPEVVITEPRIGWSGFVGTHPGDLDMVGTGVEKALRYTDGRLWVVGGDEGIAEAIGIARRRIMSTGATDTITYGITVRSAFNIGITPLAPSVFNRAKSWLKPLEFMALGIPTVASPTVEYRALAQLIPLHIAESSHAWASQLSRLARDPGLRAEESQKGRAAVLGANLTLSRAAEGFSRAWSGPNPNNPGFE
jgi:hypothetical protein